MPIVHTTYLERVDHPVGVFAARILAQLVLMLVLSQLVWLLLMLMVVQMVRLLLFQWWLILHNGLIPKINNLEKNLKLGIMKLVEYGFCLQLFWFVVIIRASHGMIEKPRFNT